MRKFLLLFGLSVVLVAGLILANTVRYGSETFRVERAPHIDIDEGAARRLAGSIRIPTISHEDRERFDANAFRALHAYLSAIDNKSAVLGTLESVEMLLGEGLQPVRTVHLAYGHDEEVGGTEGAREIAALLMSRGVRLEMVLDEGGVIGDGILPGISRPVALVGIAEKGFLSLELSARTAGGHSSLPPAQSTIGILSAAITQLERNPMPARLEGPSRQLFDRIGPEFGLAQRAVLANLWLTRPFVCAGSKGVPQRTRWCVRRWPQLSSRPERRTTCSPVTAERS